MKSTVFIVDDDEGVREVLSWLFSSIDLAVETFSGAQEFLDEFLGKQNQLKIMGCILLDVRMPKMSGLELHQVLIENNISLPVIFLTGHGDVPMAVNALKLGAFDFIQKPFNNQQMLDQVLKAIRVSEDMAEIAQKSDLRRQKLSVLTNREQDVFSLMVKGHNNKTMSKRLEVSTKTIETHRANIIRKLQVRDLSELIQIERLVSIS